MTEKFRLERRNPLPVGKYWQDIFEHQFGHFDAWLKINRDKVDVLRREDFGPSGERIDLEPNQIGNLKLRRWYLFEVLEPAFWQGPGLPTIAGTVKSSADTEKPTEDILPPNPVESALKGALTSAGLVIGGAIVLSSLVSNLLGRIGK